MYFLIHCYHTMYLWVVPWGVYQEKPRLGQFMYLRIREAIFSVQHQFIQVYYHLIRVSCYVCLNVFVVYKIMVFVILQRFLPYASLFIQQSQIDLLKLYPHFFLSEVLHLSFKMQRVIEGPYKTLLWVGGGGGETIQSYTTDEGMWHVCKIQFLKGLIPCALHSQDSPHQQEAKVPKRKKEK